MRGFTLPREAARGSATKRLGYLSLTVIGLALGSVGCGLTEPEPLLMRVEGRVVRRADDRPVDAQVRLQHDESDGDGILSSYTTVVDVATGTDGSGAYALEYRAGTCHAFNLYVEADGFIPATERIPCVEGVQTVDVALDPGVCVLGPFGCEWLEPVGITPRSPATGATIRQNDPSIGCPAHPTGGYGFAIRFAWDGPFAAYRLHVSRGTFDVMINVEVSAPEYLSLHCNQAVRDGDLERWTWRVFAIDTTGAPIQSSPVSEFQFEPCRLASGETCALREPGARILIDASHGGGVWWFPQYGTYDPAVAHQGKQFADYVRSLGYTVDELGRDVVVTDSILEQYSMVIRAGEILSFLPSELSAYERFLERETSLVLLSDHRGGDPGDPDELAEMLGVTFTGSATGTVTRVVPHSVTGGLVSLPYVGAVVSAYDADRVELLAWVGSAPVMGTVEFGRARILFLGDVNIVQRVPRPFVDHLVTWLVL